MEPKVTQYEIDDDCVATVRFHRPGRGNSWTGRMHDGYRWICKLLDGDPQVHVIVVTGSDNVFCAGADFRALGNVRHTIDRHVQTGIVPAASKTPRATSISSADRGSSGCKRTPNFA